MEFTHVKHVVDFVFTVVSSSMFSVSRRMFYVVCLFLTSSSAQFATTFFTEWAKNKELNILIFRTFFRLSYT